MVKISFALGEKVVRKTSKVSMTAESASTVGSQRNYEIMLVLNSVLSDERVEAITDSVRQIIINGQGTVADVKNFGKRRLAYPIKHHGDGIYILINYTLLSTVNQSIENLLNITEEVLRYMIVLHE